MRRFVALARVSSREQEREGFSLDVQEEALERYAQRHDGQIVKLFRIAETASKHAERGTFKEMLAYARKNIVNVTGLLFYKVDRAARNLFDYVELERLEEETGLEIIYVAQPTENTPAGRMQRPILANMAAFYTEQQSLDVQEGQARRVREGLFPCKAPFGYRNIRVDGRGLIEVDPQDGPKVRRIFELYAHHVHTLDSLSGALVDEGIAYSDAQVKFTRSKLHAILRDRSYIGEVLYRDAWHPGRQEPLIDMATFSRVQVLLGGKTQNAHSSVYGSQMVFCRHCGRPVVVEVKTKKTKAGEKEYRYYRCVQYNASDHPSIRVNEAALDKQLLELFDSLRIEDEKVRQWVVKVLRAKTKGINEMRLEHLSQLQDQRQRTERKLNRLLELYLAGDIDRQAHRTKQAELQEQRDAVALQMEAIGRQGDEQTDIAIKVFELSQHLKEKWLTAEIPEKRRILEILCLNWTLDGVTLVGEMRKPFDALAKGLSVPLNRGDRT